MRVLLIADYYVETAGAEKSFHDLTARLRENDQLDIYTIQFRAKREKITKGWVFKGIKWNATKLLWQLVPHPLLYWRLRQCLRQVKPDVIHLHNIKHYTRTILAAIKGYPVVKTVHDFGLLCPLSQNLHRNNQICPTGCQPHCHTEHHFKYSKMSFYLLSYAFYQLRKHYRQSVRLYLAPSPTLTNYMSMNDFKTEYIPPFSQTGKFMPPNTYNQFLFVGVLADHKGVSLLLREWKEACKHQPNLHLNIVGQGREQKSLLRLVQRLNLQNNVSFLGQQHYLENFYIKSSALIFPSLGMEAFGLVMSEAMSYGRAIIASNRSTGPWLVEDQKTGLLFDPLVPGDLAKKILPLANDEVRIARYGADAKRKYAQMFDNSKTMAQLLSCYRQVAKNNIAAR